MVCWWAASRRVAWVIGKISLGLRSDYLAIATLGISEIIIYFLKFEDWLTRGVKNVNGLPRPVPYEINLQNEAWFQQVTSTLEVSVVDASSLLVKACYTGIFLACFVDCCMVFRDRIACAMGTHDARHSR